jgi:hypothetical protein
MPVLLGERRISVGETGWKIRGIDRRDANALRLYTRDACQREMKSIASLRRREIS